MSGRALVSAILLLAGLGYSTGALAGSRAQPDPPRPSVTPLQSSPNEMPQNPTEAVPPPTVDSRLMYWQPGHWAPNASGWDWLPGEYVQRPWRQTGWTPGHWARDGAGTSVFVSGNWQG